MDVKTDGIVLSSIKHTDSQIITHIFTQEKGTIPFIVRLSNSKKSLKKKNAFQPLTFLTLSFHYKENRNLQQLREWNINYLFTHIPYDDVKRTMILFLAEILSKTLRNEAKNEALFTFLHSSIQCFDLQAVAFTNFHVWFLIQLSKFIGIGPTSKKSLYFDLVEAEYTNVKPHHANYLEKELLEAFNLFINSGIADFHLVNLNRQNRHFLLQKTIDFLAIRNNELTTIKSLPILIDLFK